MKVWGVIAPDRVRELVRVGALVKGKVIAVEGNRVLLDFGDFVGEGEWEATQPLPNEGDVILVRIEGEGFPIPLKFVKRIKVAAKEVVARRLPEVVLEHADLDRNIKEFAALLKIATAVAQKTEGGEADVKGVHRHQNTPLLVALPFIVEDRRTTLYMLVDGDGKRGSKGVYTVRLFLEETPWGPMRVDVGYLEDMKRITVSLILKDSESARILQSKVDELKKRLSGHGLYPTVFVFFRPELVGKIPLVSSKGIVEARA